MASSYAAAISALITTSTLNPPIKPSRPPSRPPAHGSIRPSCPDSPRTPKTSPPPDKPAELQHPTGPLRSYEEQQENPADYGIGRQHQSLPSRVKRAVETMEALQANRSRDVT